MRNNKVEPLDLEDNNKLESEIGLEKSPEETTNQEPQRDKWSGKLDFFLSALSFSGKSIALTLMFNTIEF